MTSSVAIFFLLELSLAAAIPPPLPAHLQSQQFQYGSNPEPLGERIERLGKEARTWFGEAFGKHRDEMHDTPGHWDKRDGTDWEDFHDRFVGARFNRSEAGFFKQHGHREFGSGDDDDQMRGEMKHRFEELRRQKSEGMRDHPPREEDGIFDDEMREQMKHRWEELRRQKSDGMREHPPHEENEVNAERQTRQKKLKDAWLARKQTMRQKQAPFADFLAEFFHAVDFDGSKLESRAKDDAAFAQLREKMHGNWEKRRHSGGYDEPGLMELEPIEAEFLGKVFEEDGFDDALEHKAWGAPKHEMDTTSHVKEVMWHGGWHADQVEKDWAKFDDDAGHQNLNEGHHNSGVHHHDDDDGVHKMRVPVIAAAAAAGVLALILVLAAVIFITRRHSGPRPPSSDAPLKPKQPSAPADGAPQIVVAVPAYTPPKLEPELAKGDIEDEKEKQQLPLAPAP